jgi:hypothetical protein
MRIARVCEQPREDCLSVLRQRSGFASVLGWCFHGAGASRTLALPLRWSARDAGVEKGAKRGYPNAGV